MLSPVRYTFKTRWLIDADKAAAAHAITDLAHWVDWWQGLESLEVITPASDILGSEVKYIWRSVGYRLTLTIRITEYTEGEFMKFTAAGDLNGFGTCRFESVSDGQTALIITWDVSTTKPAMNLLAPILRPVFIKNHHQLMDNGERGLNRYLQAAMTADPRR